MKMLNVAILATMLAFLCVPSFCYADVSLTKVTIPDKAYTYIPLALANVSITVTAQYPTKQLVTLPILVNSKPAGTILLDFTENSTTTVTTGVSLSGGRQLVYYPFQTPSVHTDYNVTVGTYSQTVSVYAQPDDTMMVIYLDIITAVVVLWFFRRASQA